MKNVLMLLSLVSITFLNKLSILLMPVSSVAIHFASGFKDRLLNFFLLAVPVILVFSLYSDFLLINFIASILFLFFFLFAFSSVRYFTYPALLTALRVVVFIFAVHSLIGFSQFLLYRHPDAFIGLYGRSGLQGHGLAIWYALLAVFVFTEKNLFTLRTSRVIVILFLISFLFCFYGTGLVIFGLSLLVTAAILKKTKVLMIVLTGFVFAVAILNLAFYTVLQYNLDVFYYFIRSYSEVFIFDETVGVPRRLIMINNYIELALNDVQFFLFGSGPGTFNSRVSFLLNGEYSSFSFLPVSVHRYADLYIFPLWSTDLIEQGFQDGSMNQPFSSMISLVAEYGFIFFVFLSFIFVRMVRKVRIVHDVFFFVFSVSFLFLLFVVENIYEYPDIIFCYFLLNQYKLAQVSARRI